LQHPVTQKSSHPKFYDFHGGNSSMNTKVALGAATAALAIGVGFSEPASALTFSVKADAFDADTFADVGDIAGSFKFVGGTYNFINITSNVTGTVYKTLFSGNGFGAIFAAGDNKLHIAFDSDLNSASVGDTINIIGASTFLSKETFPVSVPGLSKPLSVAIPMQGTATAVPTPALLPGLIGLGVAALRRKDEETTEENA
jgi:hypothetical protein